MKNYSPLEYEAINKKIVSLLEESPRCLTADVLYEKIKPALERHDILISRATFKRRLKKLHDEEKVMRVTGSHPLQYYIPPTEA